MGGKKHKIKVFDIQDGVLKKTILDVEGDEIRCSFHYDDAVKIDTSGLEYICLSSDNLEQLQYLINQSDFEYNEIFKKDGTQD